LIYRYTLQARTY